MMKQPENCPCKADGQLAAIESYCYDLDYVPVTRVWVTGPDPRYGAQWLKRLFSSTNPGTHPSRWFNVGHAEQRKAVEQFRLEKRGFFGIVDPGPCVAPLRDIGVDA
eukprot:8571994-Pyramimonas_sp.AAC.1